MPAELTQIEQLNQELKETQLPKPAISETRPKNAPQKERTELTSDEKKIVFKKPDDLDGPVQPTDTSRVKVDTVSEPQRTVAPNVPKVEPKTDQQRAEPTAKPAPIAKVADIVAEPAPVRAGNQPIVPKGATVKEFDYTGYTPEQQIMLKNMSVQSREQVVQLIKQAKEAESYKDAQFYQHPKAFQLDPQYTQLQEDISFTEKEESHWVEQLIKCRNGEQWQPITGWNGDEPVLGPLRSATVADEEQMRKYLMKYDSILTTKKGELLSFKGGFSQRIQRDTQAIQTERENRFGWVKDAKLLEGVVDIGDGVSKTVKEIREDLISMFPPYMRASQQTELCADLFAAVQIFQEELRAMKSGKAVESAIASDAVRAEPTSRRQAAPKGGGVVNGVKTFSRLGDI